MRWDVVLVLFILLNVRCADKRGTIFGMGCQKELDRHVITPPNFSVRCGSVVYLIFGFPEEERVIDRKIKFFIFSSPFAWH